VAASPYFKPLELRGILRGIIPLKNRLSTGFSPCPLVLFLDWLTFCKKFVEAQVKFRSQNLLHGA
jgi:hypothetical protein